MQKLTRAYVFERFMFETKKSKENDVKRLCFFIFSY